MALLVLFLLGCLCFFRPKYGIAILLLTSIALPVDHNDTSQVFSLKMGAFNFLYTDFILFSLFIGIGLKELSTAKRDFTISQFKFKAAIICFLFAAILAAIIGVIFNYPMNQVFYDLRPMLYFSILLINFKSKSMQMSLQTLTVLVFTGIFCYTAIVFSYFILLNNHPLSQIFQVSSLGRVVFHNEYLFIIAIPMLAKLISLKTVAYTKRGICLFLLLFFSAKIIVSMGRGMLVFIAISFILFSVINFRTIKISKGDFSKVFKISLVIILLFSGVVYLVLPFIWGDQYDIFINYYLSRFSNYHDADWQDTHIAPRLIMIKSGISEFLSSPLFGHGNGYYFSIQSAEWDNKVSFVDSTLITILIRAGLLGFVPLLAIAYLTCKKLFLNCMKNIEDKSIEQVLRICYFNGIATIFIYSIFNSALITSTSVASLFIIIGVNLQNQGPNKLTTLA